MLTNNYINTIKTKGPALKPGPKASRECHPWIDPRSGLVLCQKVLSACPKSGPKKTTGTTMIERNIASYLRVSVFDCVVSFASWAQAVGLSFSLQLLGKEIELISGARKGPMRIALSWGKLREQAAKPVKLNLAYRKWINVASPHAIASATAPNTEQWL